ncbi:MAG: Histidine kinase [Phycisphaerales bacterium]|nr:Histidine kinase [Phycisphaerales bacterium]
MPITIRPSPHLTPALTAFAYFAPAAVSVGSLIALAAWATRAAPAAGAGPWPYVSMNPVTTVCMLLASVALALRVRPSAGYLARAVAAACAAVVVIVGALKLVSFGGPLVPLDHLLFASKIAGNVMAPNTAMGLVLIGASILLLDVRAPGGIRYALVPALSTAAIAFLAITGYLYHVMAFYRLSGYIPMALSTAAAFMLLSLGALAARPDEEPIATFLSDTAGGVVARRLIPVACILPLLLGWLRIVAERAGVIPGELGITLYSLATTIVFIGLIWWIARSLQRLDVARQQAQRSAADEHRLLRTLVDHLPDTVFVKDRDYRFLLRSRGTQDPGSGDGKADGDPWASGPAVPDADDRRIIETGQPTIDREDRTVDAGGKIHWVSTTKVPYRNSKGEVVGIVGIAHDITKRRLAEEERDRFFTLTLDLVCIYGFDGYFKRTNPAWETALGYTPEELQSRPWIEFVHPDDVAATIAEEQKLALGAVMLYFENRYRAKDGSYRWLSWTAVPVVKERRIYAVARDMTRRKEFEEQLRQANRKLDESVRSERAAMATLLSAQSKMVQTEKLAGLGQMVAGVAHEINNPLSFVANNVAVLQRDFRALMDVLELYHRADATLEQYQPGLLSELREMAERIDLAYTTTNLHEMLVRSREGLKRIHQIVKDLRDFARLDEADLHEVDINQGIQSTVNIILGYAKRKQVRIETDLAPLPRVACYPAKVNQVVMNLLTNAIDASKQEGIVAVRTRSENGDVRIEVSDTGTGIDPKVRDRIFDPFFTTKPPGEGTGLGLSISYGIIKDHGGSIDVQSELGKGSTFAVRLPRGEESGKRSQKPEARSQKNAEERSV